MEDLNVVVAVLVALSVASERLVEIVKGAVSWLNQKDPDPRREGWRRAVLQALAVAAGLITALLSKPALVDIVSPTWTSYPGIFALGLLASGGSGFWNSILTYLGNVKDIKKRLAAGQSLDT